MSISDSADLGLCGPGDDQMPIAVRGFVPVDSDGQRVGAQKQRQPGPSGYTLVFDTETMTDAAQQIRFGVFHLYDENCLNAAGIFYDPETLAASEIELLHRYGEKRGLTVGTVADFIEEIFFPYGYDARATIVGFNLPFDLSRIAIGHGSARGKMMHGGFTFKLSERKSRPAVQVKHLSRRASIIRFTVPGKQRTPRGQRRRKLTVPPHRGFFVDVRTIAAALTSRSFSLGNLAEFLSVSSRKLDTEEHGGPLTEDYLTYAVSDVETTWECFVALCQRYSRHALTETPIHKIYSEAGIGKAYLRQMGVAPWKEQQLDMPPELLGAIVSSYYGGRSEVHIRRQVRQVAQCDFLSMYPTVCVLMGLWRFVTATGVEWHDATAETQSLLDSVTIESLRDRSFWSGLHVLVEIAPDGDAFPVRARYGTEAHYTIGLNHLTANSPLWFTLADCIASKILTGKAPRIRRAVRFRPREIQNGLREIAIAGNPEYVINPIAEDFYKRLIDLRTATKAEMRSATGGDRDQLDATQMALKILANSTSYGIFFELNPEELTHPETVNCYARHQPGFPIEIRQKEKPGQYFHPLLATLITGAARLMLASAEYLALDAGLDWVFCDTDSLAIAKPANLADDAFFAAVERVRAWFEPLNPYAKAGSILKFEDLNYGVGQSGPNMEPEPMFCFAVSAKRYALFNRDATGRPIIRKASAHGLGHLMAPYGDDDAPDCIPAPMIPLAEIGVDRWQHDVWFRIISAALDGHPAQVRLDDLPGLDKPAVSRYAATTPTLLRWFKRFNEEKPYREQVRPFGFMLAFQASNAMAIGEANKPSGREVAERSVAASRRRKKALDAPRAVAPFDRAIGSAAKRCFDRDSGEAVSLNRLKTYRQALNRYHLSPEAKFLGGNYTDAGPTRRRHIVAREIHTIGKEANRWEEQFFLGADPEAQAEYGMSPEERQLALIAIREGIGRHSIRKIAPVAHVGRNLLGQIANGCTDLPDAVAEKLLVAIATLDQRRKRRH